MGLIVNAHNPFGLAVSRGRNSHPSSQVFMIICRNFEGSFVTLITTIRE